MISESIDQSRRRILELVTNNYKIVIKKWLIVLYNRPQVVILLFATDTGHVLKKVWESQFNTSKMTSCPFRSFA